MIFSESGYGSGRSRTALTTLKIAVFAPIPSESAKMAMKVKPGCFSNCRNANRRSSSMILLAFSLLVTKRDHWIDTCGAARRNKTGCGRDCGEQRCNCEINRRIERVDLEENRFQGRREDYS